MNTDLKERLFIAVASHCANEGRAWALVDIVLAELAGELRDAESAPTHRHFKGGYYRVLTHGKLERDQSEVVIYKAMNDGTVWVRPAFDFYDGRFTPLQKAIDEVREA